MTAISKKAIVPYTQEQMYNLVNDIAAYPDFLPWCNKAEVLSQTEEEIRATLHLSKGGMQKSFTTCNRLQKNRMIEVRLVSGPFHHLEGFWRFDPHDSDSSSVSLDMEFEFANKLISFAIGPVFHQIASSLVDAFTERAQSLYGK